MELIYLGQHPRFAGARTLNNGAELGVVLGIVHSLE